MLILVVDDIQIIRSGIISAISGRYPEISFAQAENGLQALDIVASRAVDLIITDIKMPLCDGLTMIERLRKNGSEKPIIILTGFGEFSLAEKALNMGVDGYLLKPIENEPLFAMLEKALHKLKASRALQGLLEENQWLNEQQRHSVLAGAIQKSLLLSADAGEIAEFEGCWFCLAVIAVDPDFHSRSKFHDDEVGLVRYAVLNIIEYLDLDSSFYTVEHPGEDRQTLLLFYAKEEAELEQNTHIAMQRVRYELENTVPIPVSIGVSDTRRVLDGTLYHNAVTALGQKLVCRQGGIFLYCSGAETVIAEQDAGLLELYLRQHDLDNFGRLLEAVLLKYSGQDSLVSVVNALTSFLLQILVSCCGGQAFSLAGELEGITKRLGDMQNIDELVERLVKITAGAFSAGDITPRQEKKLALQVREYIDGHYRDNISVKELAERFSINYSYLSSLFAKEIGMGIIAYCTHVRIEGAKTLLRDSVSDIGEIAGLVGYDDLQYFYRIFKKQTGITPLAFRNTQKKSNK